jgi:nucleotide-binding universal stress UspA family protein
MLKIERILCPVDFSEFSAKACEYACSLARRYKAKLFVQHVIEPLFVTYPYYDYASAEVLNRGYREMSEKAIRNLRQATQSMADGIQPEFVVHTGLTAGSILFFAEEQDIDLIVMGTHGRQGLDRMAMGSVAEKTLRKAHCPVLTIRQPSHDFAKSGPDGEHSVGLRKILFCTDFSDNSNRALNYALSLAGEYNAELTLLHVLENLPASTTQLETATEEIVRRMEKPVPSKIRERCAILSLVRVGKPYQQIIQLALESQSDLIVMGAHGRNALDSALFGSALFGSTTHRVLQLGAPPVLVVPGAVQKAKERKGVFDVAHQRLAAAAPEG